MNQESKNPLLPVEVIVDIIKSRVPTETIYTDYPEGIRGYQMPTREHYLMMVKMCEDMFRDVIDELTYDNGQRIETPVNTHQFKKQFYSDEDGMVKVGLYDVGQEYGGAEEGGWYYTVKHLLQSKVMPYEEAVEYVEQIDKENKGRYYYQGYQVAHIELATGQYEKTHSQYYC